MTALPALAAPPLAAFLNPALLGVGAALVAVPILIHLLSRRQVRRVPWAAMQWLLAALRRHQRRLRLENWLVLALRVAAVALLALALARPIVTSSAVAGLLGHARRSVYLAIDTSYSTNAKAAARSVSDLVKAEADRVLSGIREDDTVCVVVTNDPRVDLEDGTEPYLLIPRTVGRDGGTRSKEALASLRPRDARARWADALRLLQMQMAPEDVNRVVVAITDFQAVDWEPRVRSARGEADPLAERLTALAAAGASLRIVNVGGDVRRNLAISDVRRPAEGPDAFVGRSFRVDVRVANFGTRRVEGAQLALYLGNDATPLRRVEVPPLDPVDAATGEVKGEVIPLALPMNAFRVAGPTALRAVVSPPASDPEADALGLDSQRAHVLRIRERIRVLVWAATGRLARTDAETYLRGVYGGFAELERGGDASAARMPPVYSLETAASESDFVARLRGSSGARPDLAVIANVMPRSAGPVLVDYVRDGGALLAFAGENVDPAGWNEPFHDDGSARLLPFRIQPVETKEAGAPPDALRLDFQQDTGHPLAAPFRDKETQDFLRLVQIQVTGRMPFAEAPAGPPADGGAPPGTRAEGEGRVVLRFGDGKPAVVAGRFGDGRTAWVGTSVDEAWLDANAPTFFLPVFLDEAAVWLTRPEDLNFNLEVGQRIAATLPRDAVGERVASPGGGEAVPSRRGGLRETDRPVVTLDRVGTAGVWRLTYRREGVTAPPSFEEPFAVNVKFEEGALLAARADRVRERLPEEADVAVLTSWSEEKDETAEGREGDASRLLLWILLGVLAVESLAAWQFGRRRSIATEER